MKPFLLLIFAGAFFSAAAQDFPAPLIGDWEGELHWYKRGSDTAQKVRMTLTVRPTDSAGLYTWGLAYGANAADNRPYVMRPVDRAKGHWVIDERNGILIDQYWVGGKFCSQFTVGSSVITDCYWREGKRLIAEFISTTVAPARSSGAGTEASPAVNAFEVRSYQRAVLRRKQR